MLRDLIATYEAALPQGAWPNWVLGNHDTLRIASRVGPAGTRLAAMLLLTLRGTPTLYYGDEIGMEDVEIRRDEVLDPFEKNVPGIGVGRDPARTPMHWRPGNHCGFTRGTPWLPVGDTCGRCNVQVQADDPHSMLSLCRRLLSVRRAHTALTLGDYVNVPCEEECLAYIRRYRGDSILVMLNFSEQSHRLSLTPDFPGGRIVVSTNVARADENVAEVVTLGPTEGVVIDAT